MSSTDAKTAALLSEVDSLLDSLDLPDSDPNQPIDQSSNANDGDWNSYFGGDSNSSFDLGSDNLSINAPNNHHNDVQFDHFDANAEFDSIINGSSSTFSPTSYTSPPTVSLNELSGHPTHTDLRSPLPAYLTASPSPTAATAGSSSVDGSVFDAASVGTTSSNQSRVASPYSPALSSSSHDHPHLYQSTNPLTSPPAKPSAYDPSPAHGTAHFNTHAMLSPSVLHDNMTTSSSNADQSTVDTSSESMHSDPANESDPFASYFGPSGASDPFGSIQQQAHQEFPSFEQSSNQNLHQTNQPTETVSHSVDKYFGSDPTPEHQQSQQHEQQQSWESQHAPLQHAPLHSNDPPHVTQQQQPLDHQHQPMQHQTQWPDATSHYQSETVSHQPPADGFNDYFHQSTENQFDASLNHDFIHSASSSLLQQSPETSYTSSHSSPYQSQPSRDYSQTQISDHSVQSITPPDNPIEEFDSVPLSNAAADDFLSYNPHAHRSISQSISHSFSQSAIADMKPVELDTVPAAFDAYQPPLRSPIHDPMVDSYQQSQQYQPSPSVQAVPPNNSDPSSRPYTRPPPHPIVSFGFGGRLVVTFPRMIRPFAASIRQVSAGNQDGYEVNNGQNTSDNRTITSVRSGPVRIVSMSTVAEKSPILAPLVTFPGPLSKLKGKDKQKVQTFIDHVSEQYAERPIMTSGRSTDESISFSELNHRIEASRLLWRTLDILVDRVGNDSASEVTRSFVDLLTKPARNRSEQNATNWDADSQSDHHSAPGLLSPSSQHASSPTVAHSATVADSLALREKHIAQQSALSSFPTMLLQGRKREAIELALRHELFDHALMLARDDDAMSKHVTSTICRLMDNTSILRTLYLVGAGMESQLWSPLLQSSGQSSDAPLASVDGLFANFPVHPKSITAPNTPALISSWRSQVALCLANPSSGNAAFLQHMGDYLWAMLDQPVAAHVCYIVSGTMSQMMSSIPAPTTRVALIGADHRRRLRLLADEEHIMATEIFEFTKGTDSSTNMLPYQFALAAHLSDLGSNDTALRYCEELSTSVKSALKRESQSNNQANSSTLNPLFVHQLSVFEHRLRILLNAPATAPVSAKLVNGLFSVLDKGINMLVGQEAAPVSNSAGAESRSQWGEAGVGWERKVMNKPLSASPLVQPQANNHSMRAPSPVPMHSLDHSPTHNHLSRPSTARMQSGDSLASSSSGGLPLSRSGDIQAQRNALSSHQMSQSYGVPSALTQAGFQPVEQHQPSSLSMVRQPNSDAIGQLSVPQRTSSHDMSPQQYPPHPFQQPKASPPQPMSTQHGTHQPPANAPATDLAAASAPANEDKPGIIKRLGSVGGLFKMWAGAEKKPTTKEANLEEDHSFTWDAAQQKYVFRDKEGNEVAEKSEADSSKPGPPPPTVSDEMKQRWATEQPVLPPPAPSGSLPPPMMPGGANLFAKKGAAVMNRYALSVGSEFTAPDSGAAVALPSFQPQFGNNFSSSPSQPAQLYTPSVPSVVPAPSQYTAPSAPHTSMQSVQSAIQAIQPPPSTQLTTRPINQTNHQLNNQPAHQNASPLPSQSQAQMPVGTSSRPPVFQPQQQRSSPSAPAAFVPPPQPALPTYGQHTFQQPPSNGQQTFMQPAMPGAPVLGMPNMPALPTIPRPGMPQPSSRPMPHYPQRPPPQY